MTNSVPFYTTMKWIALALAATLAIPSVRGQSRNEGLDALVQVLSQNNDPEFQHDILKGMSDGLKGRRNVIMPNGWEDLAQKLLQSPNGEIRELTQGLSLTFGSRTALKTLR